MATPAGYLVPTLVAVAALAALLLTAASYAPQGRGEGARRFWVVVACALTGASAGGAVYLGAREVLGGVSASLFGFLGCVLAALVVAAFYALRRR